MKIARIERFGKAGPQIAYDADKDKTSQRESPVIAEAALSLPDMPEAVLDGNLGDVCRMRMPDFPRAYAWPALLAVAAQLIRPRTHTAIRTNLYVALIGPVHSGKTAAIERARYLLGVDLLPQSAVLDLKAGSAEGLLEKIGDRSGRNVLYAPDELSHLFEKAQIKNASFAYILNSLFYRDTDSLTVAHGREITFGARLSILGGIVDQNFDDSFGAATTSGTYDRFLFGQCPSGFTYLYRPEAGARAFSPANPESSGTDPLPIEAEVDPDVWLARDRLAKDEGINPRVLEISLRAAAIAAAFDNRPKLLAEDLGPSWALARYQERVRILLAPNPGKNFEAQAAFKILGYLNRHAPHGELVRLRDMLNAVRAYVLGPSIVERALTHLGFSGAVEQIEQQPASGGRKTRLVRLVLE